MLPKGLLIAIIIISFIGFLDASYLTVQHYNQGIIPCVVFQGCEQVTTSKYSTIGDVPISLFGVIYYLAIFISAIIFFDSKKDKTLFILGYLPIAGFVASMFLLFLQIFVIKALCIYCIISVLTSTILFVLGLKVLQLRNEILRQS